ncbi:MAG TPA: hypothetical protein DEF51_33740 [Myxococcales bacterium]|nr:hypothetical protein [Myxococcales bacterium]
MFLTIVILVGALLLLFGLVSRRLSETIVTAPMVFVGVGLAIGGSGLGLVEMEVEGGGLHVLGEVTLALVLFADAARIDVRSLAHEAGLPARLLGVAMPLVVAAGAGMALLLLPSFGVFEAALLGAILAPTDAALSQSVLHVRAVPARIRQALNAESGLNDGLALPVVVVLISLASGHGRGAGDWAWFIGRQVVLGPAIGLAICVSGGWLVRRASEADWMTQDFRRLSGMALPLLAFGVAEAAGGNGFLAAFVGGLGLGHTQREQADDLYAFVEAEGQFLMLLVFTALGALLIGPALARATWRSWLYVAASLTVVRMVPVGLSMLGARARLDTTSFLGWFGPRGLASLLFALLLIEDGTMPHRDEVFAVVILTVFASVLLHGLTAAPLSKLYGRRLQEAEGLMEHEDVTEHPLRVRASEN